LKGVKAVLKSILISKKHAFHIIQQESLNGRCVYIEFLIPTVIEIPAERQFDVNEIRLWY